MSVFIIAESGVNHCGSLTRALDMIDVAAVAGADACKFQFFDPERFPGESRELLRPLAFKEIDFRKLADRCHDRGIEFLVTPFHEFCIYPLISMGVKRFKISSQSVTNMPLLEAVAKTGLPVLISNGMCTNEVLDCAVNILGYDRTMVMSCISQYPTPDEVIDMGEIKRLSARYAWVGYSSHSKTIWDCVAAAACDAEAVEKHFTMSRTLPGPDQSCSAEPAELRAMVKQIRLVGK